MRTPTLTAGQLHPQPKLKEVVSLGGWGRPRNESRMLQLDDSDLGGGPRLGTSTPFPHICAVISPPQPEDGCIAMRLLSLARHKWPSKADGRETLVDVAGAPPGFPLVPTP